VQKNFVKSPKHQNNKEEETERDECSLGEEKGDGTLPPIVYCIKREEKRDEKF